MPHSTSLPEKFIHEIWAQQLFHTGQLESHEGEPVRVLDPGVPNRDSGPDFLHAKIQIGDVVYAGEVEIHRSLDEWTAHMHQYDPRYNRVILHVVMNTPTDTKKTTTECGRIVPILILDQFLIEPVRAVWEKSIGSEREKRPETIPCYEKNESVSDETKHRWIQTLGNRRIELKVRALQNRLHELASPDNYDLREPAARYGELPPGGEIDELPPPLRPPSRADLRRYDVWEQLLYESIAEALGYSKNQSPFRRLSSLVPFPRLREIDDRSREAMLFLMAGMLDRTSSDPYATKLLGIVRRSKIKLKQEPMHPTEWQFFRLRPRNFPTLRIAGLAVLVDRMIRKPILDWLIDLTRNPGMGAKQKLKEIRTYFIIPATGYWKWHYTFGKKASRPIINLIGRNRIDEIIINVLIPFLILYARTYKNAGLRLSGDTLLDNLLAPGVNTVTRTIDAELLRRAPVRGKASDYQGKIQLYTFYCREERCGECEIGQALFT
jgi:hypothetical protein